MIHIAFFLYRFDINVYTKNKVREINCQEKIMYFFESVDKYKDIA